MASLNTIDQQAGPNSASLAALQTTIATNSAVRQNLIDFMVAAKMANQHLSEGKTSAPWSANFAQTGAGYETITYQTLNGLFCYSSALSVQNETGITNAAKLAIQYQNALNKRDSYRGRGLACLPPLPW